MIFPLTRASCCAAQDGLSESESARHDGLATKLGVGAETLREVRAIVEEEGRIQARKRALFRAGTAGQGK